MAYKKNREYFWSNKFVDPKRKFRFTVEFGGDLDKLTQSKYPWMIKSISKPKYSADYETIQYKNQFTNAVGPIIPKSWSWKEVTVKFINPYSFTFASEVKQDLDEILSMFISLRNNGSSYVAEESKNGGYSGKVASTEEEAEAQRRKENDLQVDLLSVRLLGRQVKIYDLSMAYEPQEAANSIVEGIPESVGLESSHYNLTPLELKLGEMYPNGCWVLEDPWITNIDFGDFDYSSDDMIEISITFNYKKATYNSFFHDKIISRDPDKAVILAQETIRATDAVLRSNLDSGKKDQTLNLLKNNYEYQLEERFEPTNFSNNTLKDKRLDAIKQAKDYIDTSLKLGEEQRVKEQERIKQYVEKLAEDTTNYNSSPSTYSPAPKNRPRTRQNQ